MLEQKLMYHASGQSHISHSNKIVLMSTNTAYAVNLFELFSQANFDICYTKRMDETLISAVKPLFIVYYLHLPTLDLTKEEITRAFHVNIRGLHQFNIPIILLLDDSLYLSLAPIDIPNVSPVLWPSSGNQIIEHINQIVEAHPRFAVFEDGVVFKDLVIDTKRMIVRQNNTRVDITKTEYELLIFFINSAGVVQSRNTLLEEIWQLDLYEGSNIVDVHIKSLRKKLNDSAVDPKYIVTVRGVGYRLADI